MKSERNHDSDVKGLIVRHATKDDINKFHVRVNPKDFADVLQGQYAPIHLGYETHELLVLARTPIMKEVPQGQISINEALRIKLGIPRELRGQTLKASLAPETGAMVRLTLEHLWRCPNHTHCFGALGLAATVTGAILGAAALLSVANAQVDLPLALIVAFVIALGSSWAFLTTE